MGTIEYVNAGIEKAIEQLQSENLSPEEANLLARMTLQGVLLATWEPEPELSDISQLWKQVAKRWRKRALEAEKHIYVPNWSSNTWLISPEVAEEIKLFLDEDESED